MVECLNAHGEFACYAYGPSGVAPTESVRDYELYFERLEKAGLGGVKRPDLLVFRRSDADEAEQIIKKLGGEAELPFIPETDPGIRELLAQAIVAIECENSLWVAKQMPAFGKQLKPMARLGGAMGLPKTAVLPTIILKEQDRGPLQAWEDAAGVPIHIWHSFYDLAYGISLSAVQSLIANGTVEPIEFTYQAPGGATTRKTIYKIYYLYTYPLGEALDEPMLKAQCITDKNGHILPYVTFEGGTMELKEDALNVLRKLS